jgi:hypothetical protein
MAATTTKNPGFKEDQQEDALLGKVAEWDAKCIPIEDLSYEKSSIRDVPIGEMPELPIGIFIKNKSSADGNGAEGDEISEDFERLRTFTVHPDVGSGEFVNALGKLESKGMRDAKKVVNAISRFLAVGHEKCPPAIQTIGGMPLTEAARRYGNSAQRLIEDMYLADVVTMMIGVRLAARGRDYYATMGCPVRNCKRTCKEQCSMDVLKIRGFRELKHKPVIRVELPHGIPDGKGIVKKVYFSPLKFHQLDIFFKQNIQPREMLEHVIVGIPESRVYGIKAGNPFCEDLFRKLEKTGEDQRILISALQKIKPGPDAQFKFSCDCGDEEVTYPLPWSLQPQEFLFFSNMHPDDSDDDDD